ncbi:MAG: hypothetical protein K0U52_04815 [Gammaproteobacteria bacterium]|nr:hypothetical protein [Gammaproteobacteria bacterium]
MRPLDQQQVRLLPQSFQDKYLGKHKEFGRYGVSGDGTCFFHSICAAKNVNDYLHKSPKEQERIGHRFRCGFTQHLTEERWNRFKRHQHIQGGIDAATARRHFCDNRKWANEIMIRYVAEALKINLIFIDQKSNQVYCGIRQQSNRPLIIIMWIDQMHFEPIVQIRERQGDQIGVQFLFDPKNQRDQDIIRHIYSSYALQCT